MLASFFCDFIQIRIFYPQHTLRQLIQSDLESRFLVRSQLGPSIQSGTFPSAGLQVATQSTHLLKDCHPQLVSNPHCFEIQPPKCMLLHPTTTLHLFSFTFFINTIWNYIFINRILLSPSLRAIFTVSCLCFFLTRLNILVWTYNFVMKKNHEKFKHRYL